MNNLFVKYIENNSEQLINLGYRAIISAIILIVCYLIAKIIRNTISKAHSRYEKFDVTLVPVLSSTSTYIVFIIGIIIILDIFKINTAGLITLLGAAGIAIGFALKDTLSNIAAGIMLLLLRPFRSGDFVEFGSTSGTIKQINLFNTVLETFDGLYISAPNSIIWGNNIKNYTKNGKRRIDITVGISYSDSIDAGLQVLKTIGASETRFLNEPAFQTIVLQLSDSSVDLQLRGWTKIEDYWATYWELNKRVKEEIEAAGLTIPFPQTDVHIKSNDAK